jgi:hypothetical protein
MTRCVTRVLDHRVYEIAEDRPEQNRDGSPALLDVEAALELGKSMQKAWHVLRVRDDVFCPSFCVFRRS